MIAQRIRALRKALHMTQTEFGKAIGLSQGYLTSIESGKRNVTDRTAIAICRCFLVNREWLRDGVGEMFATERTDLIVELAEAYQLEPLETTALRAFLELTPTDRRGALAFLCTLADAVGKDYETSRERLLAEQVKPYAARGGGAIDLSDLDKLDS